ncbi:unnamed protein product [Chrysodeixis includens]|uniref:Transmembrane protein 131 n=1 Tax=Chrysodeixis includens TaxID=689277 RepID=A0A9P0FS72_CHRIL|nr:unnamed protein product [Chrysodeixis includens]
MCQEWGKQAGAGGRGGRAVAAGALQLWPPALEFGRAALAAAHSLTVTLTNTANTTMHLASVAGTTPDFHASFFESKAVGFGCTLELAVQMLWLVACTRGEPSSPTLLACLMKSVCERAVRLGNTCACAGAPKGLCWGAETLPPQANTTFSVVYLGRREGPVSAHLYIHTSLGVHKYPVSAEGVASEYGVWPLVGVRVPLNASVEPLLTLHNPTAHPIQVSEVYSSGAWLGLALPGGEDSAPRAAWSVPARGERALVRLRLAPPPPVAAHPHPLTAYIRIKANITGGGLVVCVEARSVAAGEYVSPLQLRLRTRGSRDPPDTFDISVGNSAGVDVALEAGVWAARCAATPPSPPPPPDPAPPTANGQSDKGTANGNGVKSEGVYVSLLEPHLVPHQDLMQTAQVTLDYAKMWAGHVGGAEGAEEEAGADGAAGAWCAGWLRLGRAALPYSLRLLPGTLRLTPPDLHFITSNREDSLRLREVRVHNEFPVAVHIAHIDFGPDVDTYFEVEGLAPLTVAGGGAAVVARVRLREGAGRGPLRAHLTLRTNLTDYTLPLLLYSGELRIEWEWPHSADGALRLGALGTSSTRRVGALLHNDAPAALCVHELSTDLAGATLALQACAHLRDPAPEHSCHNVCVSLALHRGGRRRARVADSGGAGRRALCALCAADPGPGAGAAPGGAGPGRGGALAETARACRSTRTPAACTRCRCSCSAPRPYVHILLLYML